MMSDEQQEAVEEEAVEEEAKEEEAEENLGRTITIIIIIIINL